MKFPTIIISFLFLLLISCSTDPCESITCVNGDCVDGTCQCEEGFVGERCDELPCVNGTSVNGQCNCVDGTYGRLCEVNEILGYYFITSLLQTDCPNYAKQYDLQADVSKKRVCGTNHTDIGICFSNGISIEKDGKMFWIRSIVLEPKPDEFQTTWLEFEKGTYTVKNEVMTIKLENGETRIVTITQDKLTWERKLSDGGTEDCIWKEEYTLPK